MPQVAELETETISVDLLTPERQQEQLKKELAPVVAQANALRVTNAVEFAEGADFLKTVKTSQKRVTDFFGPIKKKAHEAWKLVCDGENTFLKPLQEAERTVKATMGAWQAEEERKAEAERRRLQAIEDERVRKERARQEELARQQREKEEAARRAEEDARRQAAAAENEAERKRLQAEAERKRKEAEAAAAKAAEREEQAAAVAPAAVIQAQTAVPTIKGVAGRKVWRATVNDKKAFLTFAAGDVTGMFLGCIEVSETALAKFAKGETAPTIPGVSFRQESALAVSAEK